MSNCINATTRVKFSLQGDSEDWVTALILLVFGRFLSCCWWL